MSCRNGEALIAYLYDECEPGERDAIAAHVATCPECTAELSSLGAVRRELAAWSPPDVALGFRLDRARTSAAHAVPAAPWWRRPLPAWAQAAAALLVFAAGLSIGWARSGTDPGPLPGGGGERTAVSRAEGAPPAPRTAAPAPDLVSRDELARLEQRLDALQQRLAAASAGSGPQLSPAAVKALIAESEERQRVELARVAREFQAQRIADLQRVEGALGAMQQVTGAEVRQHRDAINQINHLLVNASFRR